MKIYNTPVNYYNEGARQQGVNTVDSKRELYFINSDSHLTPNQKLDVERRLKSFYMSGILRANKVLDKFRKDKLGFVPLSSADISFAPLIALHKVDIKGLNEQDTSKVINTLVNDGIVGFINMLIERHRAATFETRKDFTNEINQRLLNGLVFITKELPHKKASILRDVTDDKDKTVEGIKELRFADDISPDKIIGILVPDPMYNIANKVFPHLGKYIIRVPIEKSSLTIADFAYTSSVRCLEDEENPTIEVDVPNYSKALQEWMNLFSIRNFCTHITRTATLSQLAAKPDELVTKPKGSTILPNSIKGNYLSYQRPVEKSQEEGEFIIPKSGAYVNRFAMEAEIARELANEGKIKLIGKSFTLGESPSLIFIKTLSSNLSLQKNGGFREKADIERKAFKSLSKEQIEHILKSEPLITLEQGLNSKKEESFILTYPKFIKNKVKDICENWDNFIVQNKAISEQESLHIRTQVLGAAVTSHINDQFKKTLSNLDRNMEKLNGAIKNREFKKIQAYTKKIAKEAEIAGDYANKFHLSKKN